jgi:histidinol-phosphate phosphatase family protein
MTPGVGVSRGTPDYTVVIPTIGRPSLAELLVSLARQEGPRPARVVVVDDRPEPEAPLDLSPEAVQSLTVRIAQGLGRGPAAARNLGARLADTSWVAFLDDDVRLPEGWARALKKDLEGAGERVAGVQGRIHVPLPAGRRPTDWERSTAGLERAEWATADMAYRTAALWEVDGFDERYPRAYREDADLALRIRDAGWELAVGKRQVLHPVRPADPSVSVRVQRGNIDDALMRRLHGPDWRLQAGTGRGRLPWHVATSASAAAGLAGLGLAAALARGHRTGSRRGVRLGATAGAAWLGLTVDFFVRRVIPGPRTAREVATMAWTSAVIPPVAVAHRLTGWWRHRGAEPWPPSVEAVLFDRDGTIVEDVPYNGNPGLVRPVPEAKETVHRLRAKGIRVGVITNQSGVARGLISREDVRAVNEQIDRAVGPFDTWEVCHHGPDDGCDCRKPRPGLVQAAAQRLGVDPARCVVIGDIGADVLAARAAGATAVLVPTPVTRAEEVDAAPCVAQSLAAAADVALARGRSRA